MRALESPLNCKEIQRVSPKENQSWMFIGRTDVEAETPILWPPDAKSWLIWKDPGKDWEQEEKGTTEDEMVGWHHPLDGHEFEYTPGVGDGQGGLVQSMGSQRVRQDWATELHWWGYLHWMNCDGRLPLMLTRAHDRRGSWETVLKEKRREQNPSARNNVD